MMKRLAIVSSGAADHSSRWRTDFTRAGRQVVAKRLPASLLQVSRPAFACRRGNREIRRFDKALAACNPAGMIDASRQLIEA